jgi:acyl-CoA reductase-like NAD-dependent aldehyde dehydrogenase
MFDAATAERALERISAGESLRQVAANLGLSSETRIREWAESSPENAAQYARAMEFRADVHADKIESVAAELLDGTRTDAQAARTAIDALKWTASKLRPKRYGDRQAVELTGKDGADLFASQSKDQLRAEILRRMSNPDLLRALTASGVLPDALQQALAKPADK